MVGVGAVERGDHHVGAKVAAAKEVLGTKTLTDTVDVALSEVVKLRQRKTLLELLFRPGALALDDPESMSGAWR